jgi:hypothetical protein
MHEMTDEEITAKHKRIRGTHELKYPGKESRCKGGCGRYHYVVITSRGERTTEHPCFLAIDHSGPCEFTSECDAYSSPSTVVAEAAA